MEPEVKLLSMGYIPLLTLLFVISAFLPLGTLHVFRNLIYIILVCTVVISKYQTGKMGLGSKHHAYIFLYYGVMILMIQNILFIVFHGITSLRYNFFSRTIDFNQIDQGLELYQSAYFLDLLGYLLLVGYFFLLKPSETKIGLPRLGLLGLALFTVGAIFWRSGSSFYLSSTFTEWYSSDFTSIWKLVFFVSQFGLALVWYSFWKLNTIQKETGGKAMLDDQRFSRSELSGHAYRLFLAIAGSLFLSLAFLNMSPFDSITNLIALFFVVKTLVIPFLSFLLFLSIYNRYNLIF